MPLDPSRRVPVMCLTQDGVDVPHSVQASRLAAAGARWIQLRMKDASLDAWLAEATAAVRACRRHGAVLIVNDSVEIALESGAHGVHLGTGDLAWVEARRFLGPDLIVGGTVNTEADAIRALDADCLDYAGVGPLRHTSTKRALAPILGFDGVRTLVGALQGLPCWVIGGVEPADLRQACAAGASGIAVSSFLHREGALEENLWQFLEAERLLEASPPSSPSHP